MSRLIVILTMCVLILFSETCFAGDIVLIKPAKSVDAEYSAGPLVATLSIELRKISNDAVVPINHMTFPITTTPNFGLNNPWVVADQYIRVIYNGNYPCWGIKIITDNQNYIGGLKPKPLYEGEDKQWEWVKQGLEEYAYVNGQWQTDDDWISYGGLIRMGQVADNPTLRADLGWQVRVDWWHIQNTNIGIKPVNPHDTTDFDYGTPGNDPEAIKDDWKSNWAYIIDKSNKPYTYDNIITGYFKDPVDGNIKAKYNPAVAVYGCGTSDFLAQHPPAPDGNDPDLEPDPKPADGDVAIYIAARFCSINYKKDPADPDGVPFVLPYGSYKTRIYIELSHE